MAEYAINLARQAKYLRATDVRPRNNKVFETTFWKRSGARDKTGNGKNDYRFNVAFRRIGTRKKNPTRLEDNRKGKSLKIQDKKAIYTEVAIKA